MTEYGKGLPLALFLPLFLCPVAWATSQPIEGSDAGPPVITQMNRRDETFRRYIADVEANRRLVFLRNRRQDITVDVIAGALTIFRYSVREGDDLLSIAARSNIPVSTLASLNRLGGSDLAAGHVLLLPSAPGIFVPDEPESDIERLLASSRFPAAEDSWVPVVVPETGGPGERAFYFFPGEEFTQAERAFFLNQDFFRFPLLNFRITSGYGMRASPINGRMQHHPGIDLAAPAGTEIHAAADGVVEKTGYDGVLGNFVRISHRGNWTTLYGHMQRIGTEPGARVRAGSPIGWVGSTGLSTGPHLHFEMWQGDRSQDPGLHLRQ